MGANFMTTTDEIITAINALEWDQRARVERALHGWSDDEWDEQIARDAAEGKMDNLLRKVDQAIDKGELLDAPQA